MKIAYVGDFLNYGNTLPTSGTSLVILLSLREDVSSIDVYCPNMNNEIESFEVPVKVHIISYYKYNDFMSVLKLLKIKWNEYDKIILNLLPTGFGKSLVTNFIALNIPVLLTKLYRNNNIEVIYHNSVFTNDIKALGYNSSLDKIKSFFLGIVERNLFKKVKTFVLLNLYKERIDMEVGKNKVKVYDAKYLEAITTTYQNKCMECTQVMRTNNSKLTILMHGFWGPQKKLDLALSALRKIKNKGINFKIIITGGINSHFPDYETQFRQLIELNKDIIDSYRGYLYERDIMHYFLESDLLILPYSTPGGHSGVLEQAMFFELPTIAIDFPEYREQIFSVPEIKLAKFENLELIVEYFLSHLIQKDYVSIDNKLMVAFENVKTLLIP